MVVFRLVVSDEDSVTLNLNWLSLGFFPVAIQNPEGLNTEFNNDSRSMLSEDNCDFQFGDIKSSASEIVENPADLEIVWVFSCMSAS